MRPLVGCSAAPSEARTTRWYRGDRSKTDWPRSPTNALEVTIGAHRWHSRQPLLEARPATPGAQCIGEDVAVLGLHGAPLAGGTGTERGNDLGIEVADDELSHDDGNDNAPPVRCRLVRREVYQASA